MKLIKRGESDMNEKNIVDWIAKYKIVAIARGVSPKKIVKTAEALYEGGIRTLEITFDQASEHCISDTKESIKAVKKSLGNKMCVGAGTVMTCEQAIAAKEAGADFALAPDTNGNVIRKVKELEMVSVPGALSPTEIAEAYRNGGDIVKVFPASLLGTGYIKAVRGPINYIPLMAVGGVNLENVKSFLESGFMSVGIGSNIVNNSLVESGEYDKITETARQYVEKI